MHLQRLSLNRLFGSSKTPLEKRIEKTIATEGPISIEQYMQIVLQDPEHGYYRRGDPIGNQTRDFGTAPEVSQMFGEMCGVWCVTAWQRMGSPDPFVLMELGPGHGTLLADLLRFTETVPGFHKAMKLRLFESSETLRDVQRQKLNKADPVFLETLDELEPFPTLILANEFFDNLPIRQFVKGCDEWLETMVTCRLGKLAISGGAESYQELPDAYADNMNYEPMGTIYEFSESSRSVVRRLSEHIVKFGGAAAWIDYGYLETPRSGTLDSWSGSKAGDILALPGRVDVTADVDFRALARAAKESGAIVEGIVGQREFLAAHGIFARAEILKKESSLDLRQQIDNVLNMLVTSDIGTIWKVLIIRSPKP